MKIVCYHATDKQCAIRIMQKGFTMKANIEHWLGNGIYFFQDKCLAEWWTTRPSKKFGTKIKSSAIVKTAIDIPDNLVLDLRNLNVYNQAIENLKLYFMNMFINNSSKKVVNINWKQFQCAFFNHYKDVMGKKMIIGCFSSKEQPYKTNTEKCNVLDFSDLRYIETQICLHVDSQNFITGKELI